MAFTDSDMFWWFISQYFNDPQKNLVETPLTPEQREINQARLGIINGTNNPWGQMATGIAGGAISGVAGFKPGSFMSPELQGQAFAGGANPFSGFSGMPGGGGGGGLPFNPFTEAPKPVTPNANRTTGGGNGAGFKPMHRDVLPDPSDQVGRSVMGEIGGMTGRVWDPVDGWSGNAQPNVPNAIPPDERGGTFDPGTGTWFTSDGMEIQLSDADWAEMMRDPDPEEQQNPGMMRSLLNQGLGYIKQNGLRWLVVGGAGVLTAALTNGNPMLAGWASRTANRLYNWAKKKYGNNTGGNSGPSFGNMPGGV
jgi:hypothetical protein